MRSVPFFSDWSEALLRRGAAILVPAKDRAGKTIFEDGKPVMRPEIFGRDQEQRAAVDAEGNAGIMCIACARPMWNEVHEGFRIVQTPAKRRGTGAGPGYMTKIAKRGMVKFDKIRIGAFIQMQVQQPISSTEVLVTWKVRPMFKMGLGCSACREEFQQLVRDAEETNEARRLYGLFLSKAAEIESKKLIAEQVPKIQKAMQDCQRNAGKCLHGLMPIFCAVCIDLGRVPRMAPSVTVESPKELTPFIEILGAREIEPVETASEGGHLDA